MNKLKTGQILAITFLDHVQGHAEPVEIVAYGRLVRFDRTSLTILSWMQSDPGFQDPADGNNVSFTIVRSTITTLKILASK